MECKQLLVFLLVSLIKLALIVADQRRLNEYISHFEGLSYNSDTLHAHHQRARRSIADPYVNFRFKAHGRNFQLRLRRDTTTFSQDVKRELSDGTLEDLDVKHIYEGEIWGEKNTHVHGSIINGIFSGKIYTPRANYYVEKSEVYFKEPQKFHSVIYNEADVITDPHRKKRALDTLASGCGAANKEISEWMNRVQNSEKSSTIHKRSTYWEDLSDHAHENLYTAHSHRSKRAPAGNERTCSLFLQSDTMMWEYMTLPTNDGGLAYEPARAREEITSLFAEHVKGIKKIYEDTVFQYQDMKYSGFTFSVRRVKVNETSDCEGNSGLINKFCARNIDVSNFLNLNSLRDHNEFCLAYVFTYRDFTGGTLGLAWVGSPTKASGGICERWKEYTENGRKIYKSLNTGIVTLINYGQRVPTKVSTLTFAHEVGHNFGSPHDQGPECTPFTQNPPDPNGNYIMFASATSGDRPNNSKFSNCSIRDIAQVLDAVLREDHGKNNCFITDDQPFCGNNIVEGDEDCDCGYAGDCHDTCCYPKQSTEGTPCTLRPSAQCSPTKGPCCSKQCQKLGENTQCAPEDDCTEAAYCDGTDALCPTPVPRDNMTSCNEFTQVCISGECRGSICQMIGWDQCYLTTPPDDKDFDKGKLCFVACENPSSGECISTGDEEALDANPTLKNWLTTNQKMEGIKLQPGAPCDNFQGYCDVFQKCRGVDADGPLARLKNIIFNEETYKTIKDWIIEHWWAVLLMGIGLIVLMGAFIKCCAVHTPSSNPSKPKARTLSQTLKRPSRRPQGPPPPYSGPSSSQAGAQGRPPPYNPQTQYEMKRQGQQRI